MNRKKVVKICCLVLIFVLVLSMLTLIVNARCTGRCISLKPVINADENKKQLPFDPKDPRTWNEGNIKKADLVNSDLTKVSPDLLRKVTKEQVDPYFAKHGFPAKSDIEGIIYSKIRPVDVGGYDPKLYLGDKVVELPDGRRIGLSGTGLDGKPITFDDVGGRIKISGGRVSLEFDSVHTNGELKLDGKLRIGLDTGHVLPSGKHSVLMIPQEGKGWTVTGLDRPSFSRDPVRDFKLSMTNREVVAFRGNTCTSGGGACTEIDIQNGFIRSVPSSGTKGNLNKVVLEYRSDKFSDVSVLAQADRGATGNPSYINTVLLEKDGAKKSIVRVPSTGAPWAKGEFKAAIAIGRESGVGFVHTPASPGRRAGWNGVNIPGDRIAALFSAGDLNARLANYGDKYNIRILGDTQVAGVLQENGFTVYTTRSSKGGDIIVFDDTSPDSPVAYRQENGEYGVIGKDFDPKKFEYNNFGSATQAIFKKANEERTSVLFHKNCPRHWKCR